MRVWVSRPVKSKAFEASLLQGSRPYVSKGYAPSRCSTHDTSAGVSARAGSRAAARATGTTSRSGRPCGPCRSLIT
ncbi:hypothetical protein ADK65_19390 [Streptomyces sp. NRRL B-1140]|nr:hypothetical protein ADK65_19390 [Streptomyces sp. NRRL B-1140]